MHLASKPLLVLTAADLMSPEVVTIPQHLSLQAAARRLAQAHVSGAPVVDEAGRCIGVLSATDFVTWADRGEVAAKRRGGDDCCVHSAWQMLDVEELSREEVGQFMTADPVTVAPSTPIGELARIMLDAHIHRVIVVDEDGWPAGIVSSTDMLAALAYAQQTSPVESAG